MNSNPTITRLQALTLAAVILFALALLLPMTSNARSSGKSTLCLANLHVMTRAWLLYAEDNETNIVGSSTYQADGWQTHGYPAWAPTTTIRVKNFVAFPQDENHNFRNLTLDDEIRGLQQGGLWPYVNGATAYHCPSDSRYLKPASSQSAPPIQKGGYRTYSLGNVYNGYSLNEGWNTGEMYATVYKTGEIKSPSTKLVFLEETDSQGYNMNVWDIFLNNATHWPGDPLACLHNKNSNFSFADSHVETHRWKDATTLHVFERQIINASNYPYPQNEGTDLTWFVSHYIPGEIRPELQAMLPAYK
jgi:prepilin-type processing-associated H-X9-DG protein